MTLAATTGNMEGFLCQARQNKDDENTKVGMLSASSGMTMKEPCGSVRNLRLLKPLIGLGISIKMIQYNLYGPLVLLRGPQV